MSFNFRQIEDSEILDLYTWIEPESKNTTVNDIFKAYEYLLNKGFSPDYVVISEEAAREIRKEWKPLALPADDTAIVNQVDTQSLRGQTADLVILDEAYHIDKEAEDALRDYMEK